jgi:hypothetical protein
VNELVEKLRLVEQRQDDIAKQLAFNTEITAAVNQNTADIIEVWRACRGGLRVLGWMGIALKWLTIVAACCTAVAGAYYAITHLGAPKP